MDNGCVSNLRDIKFILKKKKKLIVVISLLAMIVVCIVGAITSKKEVQAKAAILVDNPLSKEAITKEDYDYLRFINAKNIMGPTELAKSQKIMKKVVESVGYKYDLNKTSKNLFVTSNIDANMIYLNVKGKNIEKVNKMLEVYNEEFLAEVKIVYSDIKFVVLNKENAERKEENYIFKGVEFAVIGIIVGFFCAIGIAFILESLDKTVKKEQELEVLGLRVLTVIPNYKKW